MNLRSVVLELMVGKLFTSDGYTIDIRQLVRDEAGEEAEIDVKAVSREECVCVECKGMAPGNLVSKDDVQKWADVSLPRITSWLKRCRSLPNKQRFEFIASTGYTADAMSLANSLATSHRKRPISFHDGREVQRRLKEKSEPSLLDIFREHFGRP